MPSKVLSCAVVGIDPVLVEVEVDVARGLPSFNIVGLPDTAVKEARERVKAAVKNSNFEFPVNRITVNLAPADVKKEGAGFDLPIALGILAECGFVDKARLGEFVVCGELSLDAKVRGIKGALSVAIGAKENGISNILIPEENVPEASLIEDIGIFGVTSLLEAVNIVNRGGSTVNIPLKEIVLSDVQYDIDFADVAGQQAAKRALEIAAAGMHNVLMFGPPGTGKSMLAQRIPTIMPDMEMEEIIETTRIYSVAGLLDSFAIVHRPFRAPHHSISDVALIGGGTTPKPGEVSLAHNGVLFMDELPEFKRSVLEALRQPMESGIVVVSRAAATVTFPARFMFVGAMNPCPCGYFGHPRKECRCSLSQIKKYVSKISGPILDRMDMIIEVPAVEYEELKSTSGESSASMKERVIRAREIQRRRFREEDFTFNSFMKASDIRKYCVLKPEVEMLLKTVSEKLSLSVRAIHRILKVARTIADIDASLDIKREHLMEAIQYRRVDKLESLYA